MIEKCNNERCPFRWKKHVHKEQIKKFLENKRPMTVKEIAKETKLPKVIISKHIAKLKVKKTPVILNNPPRKEIKIELIT